MLKYNTFRLGLCLLVVILSLQTSPSQSADFGDHNCNIYLKSLKNIASVSAGSNRSQWGKYFEATIRLSKAIQVKHFRQPKVGILYNTYWKSPLQSEIAIEFPKDFGSFWEYRFIFEQDSGYSGYSVDLIASVSNGIDTLYDNNFDGQLVRIVRYGTAQSYESLNCP